ncbi:hypothetical protein J2Y74_004477 [Pseudomonas migulae]|jgi:hypothetical protein|uniref:SIR2 family protein n=1 Tax=Pseudomonas migulae TaxID=78543 RepID=UPI0020A10BCC|nr:SIR2 family protein [Pseudomonas migulae]MCP1520167.1 hypothetical protein [Pseudomonas migulae]
MEVSEFVGRYRNHPVLFVGAGVSLRYLESSFTWDGLLGRIAFELKGNTEYYLDVKSNCEIGGIFRYDKIASKIERDFNEAVAGDRNGKFKAVNDTFYESMNRGVNISRFKIYIASLLSDLTLRAGTENELAELKRASKNIGSIITTNYDSFLEGFFEFSPLIGNDILLSNPYGSVYKIHGCIAQPPKIIITEGDYERFFQQYELIRAQLLSIFIHNPIIFLGYNIGDENIKSLLKTIFTYVEPNSDDARKIRNNFLLVEYEEDSNSQEICEHDIDLEGFSTIRINKIKTDDFSSIYKSLASLILPVSAMDVRKVQNIVREIYSGGDIKVTITEDLDSLSNGDKILAIGSSKTIQYQYLTVSEMISGYFKIIDESNSRLLELVNKQKIHSSQFFPVFGFSKICATINDLERFKTQQKGKIDGILESLPERLQTTHADIDGIMNDENIAQTYKSHSIIWSLTNKKIPVEDIEKFLRSHPDKVGIEYKKLLCAYDIARYSE